MRKSVFALFALASAFEASACGPEFPQNLLDDRAATLADLPQRGFAREAASLLPAPDRPFTANERADWIYTEAVTREQVERTWLGGAAEVAALARGRADAASAYAAATGLPEEARRYLAGAAAYERGAIGEALERFATVLELPVEERRHYGPWALHMQGRLLAAREPDRARAAFVQLRETVAAGAEDPLGLALDSYGAQARLLLDAGDVTGATRLYAQQAAQGSKFGWTSLLRVARRLVSDETALAAAARDPLLRQLVAVHLATRSDFFEGEDEAPELPDAALRFVDALEREKLDRVEGAGRLAALAYRSGRYELAARFVAMGEDGLAAWVRAKLALRAGDLDAATRAYAQAAREFPRDEPDPDGERVDTRRPGVDYCRVRGESGTLALARGEYVAALAHFLAANDWEDAAFVAERVLTVDELVAYVAQEAAHPSREEAARIGADLTPPLRALLARRLLRSERWDEALGHFDDATLRFKAQEYVDARRAALRGGRIERAQAWQQAAAIARVDGLELLGYEFAPDLAVWEGAYPNPYSFGYAAAGREVSSGSPVAHPPVLAIAAGPGDGERARVAASEARPDRRFHYRFVAADFAARAAELVPQRSQAYAALLCEAAGYVINDDGGLATGYWLRYVAHGAYLPWTGNFGHACEVPDFPAAAQRLRAERIAAVKRYVRKALPFAAAPVALVLVLGVLGWRRRVSRKANLAMVSTT